MYGGSIAVCLFFLAGVLESYEPTQGKEDPQLLLPVLAMCSLGMSFEILHVAEALSGWRQTVAILLTIIPASTFLYRN